jgi:hypothetical protein
MPNNLFGRIMTDYLKKTDLELVNVSVQCIHKQSNVQYVDTYPKTSKRQYSNREERIEN